ncbi:hypothetical protein NX059_007263 [Plenodomus lindquistii]|nr:hypothetical protein NX059_007263 [Plenodomus lindquistii]
MPPHNIPLPYTLWHLTIEPLLALTGAYHLHFHPTFYHTYMPSTSAYNASSQIIYNQLATTYLFFAFIEAVVLRVVHDLRAWRTIVFGLALCDVGHVYAAWCEMGVEGVKGCAGWRREEWIANFLNLWPLVVRVGFLMGVGMGRGSKGVKMV